MSSVRTALAVNGLVFLMRAALNLLRLSANDAATRPHKGAVRVIGIG